jgi:hypothetical protein
MTTRKATQCHKKAKAPSPSNARRKKLEKKLLALGGKTVAPGQEENLEALLARGFAIDLPVTVRKGKKTGCDTSSAELWGEDPVGRRVAVGFALSADGAWGRHSWAVDAQRLYEPAAKHRRYFGVVLDEAESTRFWVTHFMRPKSEKVFDLLQFRAQAAQNGQPNGSGLREADKAGTAPEGGEAR